MASVLSLLGSLILAMPSIASVRTETAPRIDGRLDEAVWSQAAVSREFTQKFPHEAAPPEDWTELRVLHDAHAIYLGIRCSQPAAPIIAQLTRRDRAVESDHLSVDLDPSGQGRSAYHFEVSAAGVLSDAIRFDTRREGATDLVYEWDEIWTAKTQTSSAGWTAEIEIPFRALRFQASQQMRFGLEVRRYVSARAEIDEWSFVPRDVADELLHYGALLISAPVDRGGALELAPAIVGALSRVDRAPGRYDVGLGGKVSAGLDARWHAAEDLSLDLALNPDFAQVEADQVVLNLTSFEILQPEKRRFFLEGLAAFDTPLKLLYTRRIGQRASDPAPPRGSTVEAAHPAPIWGALKLVGRPVESVELGVFAALTGPVELTAQSEVGLRSTLLAAPATLFTGVRLFDQLPLGLGLGLLFTGVSRLERPAPSCANGEEPVASRCTHDAYVGAVDFAWHSATGALRARGQLAASLIAAGPSRTLPDGTLIRAGDVSPGGFVELAKEGGAWVFAAQYHGLGRRFDVNDAGFLERQNLHRVFVSGGYHDTEAGTVLLEQETHLEVYRRYNADGLRLAEGYQLNHSGHFANQWQTFVELHLRPRYFDDRELGDGRALERAGLLGLELGLTSDQRLPLRGELFATIQGRERGAHLALDGQLGFFGISALELGIDPTVVVDWGELRYAGVAGDGAPSFGELSAVGLGATLRLTYTFGPDLSFSAYAQPFVEWAELQRFRQGPLGTRLFRLDALSPGAPPAVPPARVIGDLNVSLVLRWEYLPGSTLYLVYARSQHAEVEAGPDGRPILDVGGLLRGPATDTLLFKLSYWWGL